MFSGQCWAGCKVSDQDKDEVDREEAMVPSSESGQPSAMALLTAMLEEARRAREVMMKKMDEEAQKAQEG